MLWLLLMWMPAGDDPPKKPVPSKPVQAQAEKAPEALAGFAEIRKAYDEAMQKAMADYNAVSQDKAKSEDEKTDAALKVGDIMGRESRAQAAKALDLAKPQAADPKAVPVLVWILQNVPTDRLAEQAADLLIQHHPKAKELLDSAERMTGLPTPWSIRVLQSVIKADDDRKPAAMFILARTYHSRAEAPATFGSLDEKILKNITNRFGAEYMAFMRQADPAALDKEAEQLLEELLAKHPDAKRNGRPLADRAKSTLFEIRNLGIGKTAPEIVGEDLDGKPMKLSDYRGKVVVLDFWGHW